METHMVSVERMDEYCHIEQEVGTSDRAFSKLLSNLYNTAHLNTI